MPAMKIGWFPRSVVHASPFVPRDYEIFVFCIVVLFTSPFWLSRPLNLSIKKDNLLLMKYRFFFVNEVFLCVLNLNLFSALLIITVGNFYWGLVALQCCVGLCCTPSSPHPLLPPLCPQLVLYFCISIPALQIGSSKPFF